MLPRTHLETAADFVGWVYSCGHLGCWISQPVTKFCLVQRRADGEWTGLWNKLHVWPSDDLEILKKKRGGFGMTLYHDISRKFMDQTLDLHKFVKEFTLSIEIWVHKHDRRGLVLSSDGCWNVIYMPMLVSSLRFASLDQIVPVLVFHGHSEVLLLPFSSLFFFCFFFPF